MCFTKKVQCDNWSLACLTVRHTLPLRGTPLREGMARRRSIDNQRNAVAHPLSERGEGTASGRSDSEAVNKSEGRGVSHNHYKDIVFLSQGHYKDIVFLSQGYYKDIILSHYHFFLLLFLG